MQLNKTKKTFGKDALLKPLPVLLENNNLSLYNYYQYKEFFDKIKNALNLHYGIVFIIPRKIAKPILSLFFPFVKLIWPMPNIKTIEETILELKNSKKSIARFGDGEIQYIVHRLNFTLWKNHNHIIAIFK